MKIPFNQPHTTGAELDYIVEAIRGRHLSGDGTFTKRCNLWLEKRIGCAKALLTHSCTAALEMAALLAEIGPGDEVIMPSFTFVSTANAFVLRGAVPVFVDIEPRAFNIDPEKIEAAIGPRTKAICVVHYAGVACEMDAIMRIADRHGLIVIEDAAHTAFGEYRGKQVGTFGALAALSFHETKNIISGEGGALLVNDPKLVRRAEILREKGTNRSSFFRGEVDKYTWVDLGSSYLPSEIIAAFLWAQLEQVDGIQERRAAIWDMYYAALAPLEEAGLLRRPVVLNDRAHSAHMFYVVTSSLAARTTALTHLRELGVGAVFHYVPLHSSPAGRRFGRASSELPVTDRTSDTLLRLPFWIGMDESTVARVAQALHESLIKVA